MKNMAIFIMVGNTKKIFGLWTAKVLGGEKFILSPRLQPHHPSGTSKSWNSPLHDIGRSKKKIDQRLSLFLFHNAQIHKPSLGNARIDQPPWVGPNRGDPSRNPKCGPISSKTRAGARDDATWNHFFSSRGSWFPVLFLSLLSGKITGSIIHTD